MAKRLKKCPHCGKKYEPRSFKIKNMEFTFMVASCNCREIEDKKTEIKSIYANSNIDKYFLYNKFPAVNREVRALKNNHAWVQKGKQIVVYGNPGNWKTGQITDLAKSLMQDFFTVKYYRAADIPDIGMREKDAFSGIMRADVLILDNFGKERSERAGGIMFKLLDYRIHNFLPTILITNYNRLDYHEIFSPEFVSRLNGFDRIKIDSEQDKREGIKYEKKGE